MLKESVDTSRLHYSRAKDNYDEIVQFPVDITLYNDKEKIKTIDAFIFRFIKLQDFMGDKLFKEILKSVGEYKDSMSLIDVLDKLEKLEIINDSDKWINFRILRNKLTHEYPDNQDDVIEGIKLAIEQFAEMKTILSDSIEYIDRKGLVWRLQI